MKKNIWFYIIMIQFLLFIGGSILVSAIAIQNPPELVKRVDVWK